MGKEEDLKTTLFQKIIEDLRANRAADIDKAYAYFWEEQQPDEFLSGTALCMGFINFEDWLVFDYKANEAGESFLQLHLKDKGDLTGQERDLLQRVQDSVMSLFEVEAVSRDKRVLIKDLLLGGEYSLRDKNLSRGLQEGDIFATRILDLDGSPAMSGCAYPYRPGDRKQVLAYIDRQYGRYVRNVRPGGTMREYLKDYGDVFNLIWMGLLDNTAPEQPKKTD